MLLESKFFGSSVRKEGCKEEKVMGPGTPNSQDQFTSSVRHLPLPDNAISLMPIKGSERRPQMKRSNVVSSECSVTGLPHSLLANVSDSRSRD